MRSLEGDVLPLDDRDGVKADLIDGALGELSLFDSTHSIHADGVSASTSILPALWRDRLIAYSNPNTNGVTALCLERHDLCVAKLVANRDKDREFVRALIGKDIVDVDIIISRLALTDISDELRDQITARVRAYGQAQCGP